jgi:hypothetical protein
MLWCGDVHRKEDDLRSGQNHAASTCS